MSIWERFQKKKNEEEKKESYGKYSKPVQTINSKTVRVVPLLTQQEIYNLFEADAQVKKLHLPRQENITPKVPIGSIEKNITNTMQRNIESTTTPMAANTIIHTNTLKGLLEGKVKDEQLVKDILKNRGTLLKHRTTAIVNLGQGTTIEIVGYLPEFEGTLREYWQGAQIEPTGFSEQVAYFAKGMQNLYGTKTVLIRDNPTNNFKVTNISITMTFK